MLNWAGCHEIGGVAEVSGEMVKRAMPAGL